MLIEQHIRGKKGSLSARRIISELMKQQWFEHLYNGAKGFIEWMNNRNIEGLTNWITEYIQSPFEKLKTLARGLKHDFNAVKNALSYNYSNGLVEGYVNKLKALKRTMYGRASVDLLEKKMFLIDNKSFQLN